MEFENSAALNKYMAERLNGRAMLAFSCGKDSIVAWLTMREYFPEITPFYLYLVPDLEFVEESLSYYEQYFDCHITRLPHPSMYRWIYNYMWQPPYEIETIRDLKLVHFEYDDVIELVWQATGNSGEYFHGVGVRAVDSIVRWAAIKKYGPVNEKQHKFFPVYDFRKQDMLDCIQRHNIKLPVDYRMFGRSFDGIDHRFLAPIKKYYPRDYQRIIEMVPQADMELYRYEKWSR